MRFGPFFYNKRKARQDKMFILNLMLYCTSKSWRLNKNCSRQREKASRIGDHIGRNFKPCTTTTTTTTTATATANATATASVTVTATVTATATACTTITTSHSFAVLTCEISSWTLKKMFHVYPYPSTVHVWSSIYYVGVSTGRHRTKWQFFLFRPQVAVYLSIHIIILSGTLLILSR